jgi:hypothetical protein
MVAQSGFFQTQAKWAANFAVFQKPKNPNDKDQKKHDFQNVIQTTTRDMVTYFKEQNDRNYRMLRTINVVIIGVGILLLAASIVRGFISGVVDAFTALGSAIGVANFVTIFLVNPQSRITRSLVDSAQFDTIMQTWGWHVVLEYDLLAESQWTAQDINTFQQNLTKYTEDAIKDIESNIGK